MREWPPTTRWRFLARRARKDPNDYFHETRLSGFQWVLQHASRAVHQMRYDKWRSGPNTRARSEQWFGCHNTAIASISTRASSGNRET